MKVRLVVFLVVACGLAFSQTVSSSVQGTVTDTTGAVVAGAVCTLTNQATTQPAKVVSLGNGAFTFASIPAGVYRLSIESPGFKTLSMADVVITAGETHALGRLSLQLG